MGVHASHAVLAAASWNSPKAQRSHASLLPSAETLGLAVPAAQASHTSSTGSHLSRQWRPKSFGGRCTPCAHGTSGHTQAASLRLELGLTASMPHGKQMLSASKVLAGHALHSPRAGRKRNPRSQRQTAGAVRPRMPSVLAEAGQRLHSPRCHCRVTVPTVAVAAFQECTTRLAMRVRLDASKASKYVSTGHGSQRPPTNMSGASHRQCAWPEPVVFMSAAQGRQCVVLAEKVPVGQGVHGPSPRSARTCPAWHGWHSRWLSGYSPGRHTHAVCSRSGTRDTSQKSVTSPPPHTWFSQGKHESSLSPHWKPPWQKHCDLDSEAVVSV